MKVQHVLWIFLLMMGTSSAWAYGSLSAKGCTKPKFTEFTPANNSEVKPSAVISFVASPNTRPESINVTVKNLPVKIDVTEKGKSFIASGRLPPKLKGPARINITGESFNACKGSDGWLVTVK